MALNGKGGSPTHNSAGATSKNTRLSSTGGSIAKNNRDFGTGPMRKGLDIGVPRNQKSIAPTLTSPSRHKLSNTGRPATTATTKKTLPSGMTQKTAKKIPIVGKQKDQSNQTSQTMKNLASYMKRKASGQVR